MLLTPPCSLSWSSWVLVSSSLAAEVRRARSSEGTPWRRSSGPLSRERPLGDLPVGRVEAEHREHANRRAADDPAEGDVGDAPFPACSAISKSLGVRLGSSEAEELAGLNHGEPR